MTTLAALLAEPSSVAHPSGDAPTLHQVLTELDALLANDSFIGDELLDQLKIVFPNDRQAEYNALCQHILDTDYPKARSVLSTLMSLPNGKT